MRVLSGIQPTGRFHWGNYFGAIRQYIDLQGQAGRRLLLHRQPARPDHRPRPRRRWRRYTLDAAIDLLALGLDPEPGHAVRAVRRARGLANCAGC